MDSVKHQSREPFHDAFFRCILANGDIADRLSLREQSDTHLTFNIVGVTDAISIIVSPYDIGVSAWHENVFWDFLIDFFADPEEVPVGYICSCCEDRPAQVHPTRESLWTDLAFGPFLEWFRGDLAHAEHLVFYGGSDYGFTAARLIPGRLPLEHYECARITIYRTA